MTSLEARVKSLEQRWAAVPPPGFYWADDEGPLLLLRATFVPKEATFDLLFANFVCLLGGRRHTLVSRVAWSETTAPELRELTPLPMPDWAAGKPPTSVAVRVVFEDLAKDRARGNYYDAYFARCHLNNKKPPGLLRYVSTWWRMTIGAMLLGERIPEWLAHALADVPMNHLWPSDEDDDEDTDSAMSP